MNKKEFNNCPTPRFKRFCRKNYALFSCLHRPVTIGVLAVMTLTYAKANSVSVTAGGGVAPDSVKTKTVGLDEVVVTGSRVPLTMAESAKIVGVITREEIHRAAVTSLNDVLKLATGVDVRQRGGFGVQTDISINGGTFDQITILLNGVDISNPQTGHNASDFPVDIADIERIEVLEGASARLFGTSAFSGAVNIVTRNEVSNLLRASVRGGSYGTVGGSGRLNLANNSKSLSGSVSGGYDRSDGYSRNSDGALNADFEKYRAFHNGKWVIPHLNLEWQAGTAIQRYGANTFYSAKYDNQFEKTEHDVLSVKADINDLPAGLQISPSVYYNRFVDHYQLLRGVAGAKAGENYHSLDVYGGSLNAFISWIGGKTAVGADIRKEHILSTAYGNPLAEGDAKPIHGSDRVYDKEGNRTNTSLFVEHDVIYNGFTLSAGLLMNKNTGLDSDFHFYPGIDVSYKTSENLKLFASWNKALRMPTFTDLYAANAVQIGDVALKPERNSTFKVGAEYRLGGLKATLQGFYSRGRDMIDWVYETEESTRYHALNIGKLDNKGASIDLSYSFTDFPVTNVRAGYAYINQNHSTDEPIFRSLYALEYLRHKVTVGVDHKILSKLSASWALRWQERMNGYHPYAKLDCRLLWSDRLYDLYFQADNITNHAYYDLGGVLQPKAWFMAGATVKINLK